MIKNCKLIFNNLESKIAKLSRDVKVLKKRQLTESASKSLTNTTPNPAVSSKKLSDLKLGSYLPGNSGGN